MDVVSSGDEHFPMSTTKRSEVVKDCDSFPQAAEKVREPPKTEEKEIQATV